MVKCNAEQQRVVETTESPLLVIAGPGSGKTKTLVDRVIYLVYDLNVPPENILVGTFTEKAAKELLSRISTASAAYAVQKNISEIHVGTLHSLFLDFLEEYRDYSDLRRGYRVLDQFEQTYLFYANAKRFNEIENVTKLLWEKARNAYGWEAAKKLVRLVNKVAEENLDIKKLERCTKSEKLPVLACVVKLYREILAEENALDFSLIQTEMWKLLQNKTVLADIRSRIRYIMVDEYQDTNRIQEEILLRMAAPANRICVVGDDDQALYRFRGATVENILRFEEKFPRNGAGKCIKIELDKNYRSHPDIIDFYNKWMENLWDDKWGDFRYKKTIKNAGRQTCENTKYPGVVKCAGTNKYWVDWCKNFYDFVCRLKKKGALKDYNQIAILSNSVKNEKIVALSEFLGEKGIPIFSPRSDRFFEREEIRLSIGAFVFLFPKLESTYLSSGGNGFFDHLEAIWSYYDWCLDTLANKLRESRSKHKEFRTWAVLKAKEIAKASHNTDYTFANLFYEMLQFPLFSELLSARLDDGMEDLRPMYNLALFSQLLTRFENMHRVTMIPADLKKRTNLLRKFFNEYIKFLKDGGINEYEDFDMVTPPGCISIMTIHQSKGLEFPITCVDSLDSVPRKNHDDIDEEIFRFYRKTEPWEPLDRIKYFDFWRLYYTAFSRAKNLLVLTGPETDTPKKSPSRYFKSVYAGIPDYKTLFEKGAPKLDLDEVKMSDVKHRYSFTSHILLYENCPVQYKFFREVEFSPVRTNAILFGTLVHETIEDVHREVLAGKTENITHGNMEAWLLENYAQLSKEQGVYLRESSLKAVLRHVENYVNEAKKDWSRIREAEVPLTLLKEHYILEGKIDLIRGKDDTLEIIDFKTDVKPDVNSEKDREKLNRYRRQLEIYAHIVQNKYGKPVSKMHLFYTGTEDGSPLVSYDFSSKSIERTIAEVDAVVERIERKDFAQAKNCDPLKCRECDFRHYCHH